MKYEIEILVVELYSRLYNRPVIRVIHSPLQYKNLLFIIYNSTFPMLICNGVQEIETADQIA
jgi:hypothetical protein